MKTISIKTYLLLLSFGIVFGIGLVVFFIVVPNAQKISAVNVRLVEQGANRLLTEQASRGETTEEQIAEAEARVAALEKSLLSSSSVFETITTFEELADKHSLRQKIDVISATNDAYTFSIGVAGPYAQILAYFADMQELPFAAITPSITWDRRALDQTPIGNGQISAHTVVTIYVAHPDRKQ